MSGGAGSIAAMISSIKNNRKQLKNLKHDSLLKTSESCKNTEPLKYAGTMSEDELKRFRTQLERSRKRQKIITLLLYSVVFASALIVSLWILY